MALQVALQSEKNLGDKIQVLKAKYKLLPEKDRASSKDYQAAAVLRNFVDKRLLTPVSVSDSVGYVKISHVSFTDTTASISADVYTTKGDRDGGVNKVSNISIDFPYDPSLVITSSVLEYSYSLLKTSALFAGAIDV